MNKLITTTALLLLSCGQQAYAGENNGDLTLKINGFENNNGRVVANLFCDGRDVMKIEERCRQMDAAVSDKHAELVFHNLPYGTYAVSVFHDENGNGTLDHNMLHFPAEPLGFSNGFQLGLFSGLPSFEKLQFTFARKIQVIDVTLE